MFAGLVPAVDSGGVGSGVQGGVFLGCGGGRGFGGAGCGERVLREAAVFTRVAVHH